MTTHSLPSQAFHGSSVRDLLAPLASLFARWTRPRARTVRETPAESARRVREYAAELRSRDPRMAAELVAAADRHELLHTQR